ncbi:MAG: hypothetical protein DRQ55_02110 [Planctomycetota bacterium]|nr:MAG: hypothetical protein DRQ55_02110 [Planctomycetota bacterium]
MRAALPLLLVAPLVLALACQPDDGSDDSPALLAEGGTRMPTAVVRPPVPWPSDDRGQDRPSIMALAGGHVWLAMQSWDGTSDGVVLSLLGSEQEPLLVHRAQAHIYGTALARDAAGQVRVLWSEQVGDGFALRQRLYAHDLESGGLSPLGPARDVVSRPGARLLQPLLAADTEGGLLLVNTLLEHGELRVQARSSAPNGGWSEPVDVSDHGFSNWSPALVAVGPGRFAVAWDQAVDGDYDVLLARLNVGAQGPRVSERMRLTDSPRFEAHASLAVAGERLYVAFEVGSENWGREGSVNKVEEALHFERTIEILAVEGGRVARLDEPFMQGFKPNASLARACEKPVIHVDGSGNLLLGFRGLPLPPDLGDVESEGYADLEQQRGGGGTGWRSSIWFTYLSRYDGMQWLLRGSHHQGMPDSNGRSDMPIVFGALPKGGAAFATAGDGRERSPGWLGQEQVMTDAVMWWQPITLAAPRVSAQLVGKGQPAGVLPVGPWREAPSWRQPSPADQPPRVQRTLSDGRTLHLALGDLHRHTDLSRCSSNWDGPFTDAARYAFDAGGLQFMAVTDHFEHMTAWDWWRNLGLMEAWNAPGRMVNLRAYERSDNLTGHRNVIGGAGELPIVGYRNQYHPPRDQGRADVIMELWPQLEGLDVITIPHTTAGMFGNALSLLDWLSFDPAHDRLVEIFQGYRGASEMIGGPRALDVPYGRRMARGGLDGGLHFGFVASSDHQSSYGSFAGAWTTGLTRGEVFEALHDRRTFASTCRMSLWTEWNGVAMGHAGRAPAGPTSGLQLAVELFDRELSHVELLIDGEVVRTVPLSGRSASHHFDPVELAVPATGSRYAYVRVYTTDGELGWSSPIRLGTDADYGADGPMGFEAFEELDGKALERRPTFDGPDPYFHRWHGHQAEDHGPGH